MHRLIAALLGLLVVAFALSGCARAPSSPAPAAPPASSGSLAGVTAVVFRSPTCTCCHEHEAYMRSAGMLVHSVVDNNLGTVKRSYGVTAEAQSCHTTAIGDYFVDGHVPLAAIEKLLSERPDLDGIALPGMPPGSPGMGGVAAGPLTVFGIRGGEVVEVFGDY